VLVSGLGSQSVDVCTRETQGPSLWTPSFNRKTVFATGANVVSCTSLLLFDVAAGWVALLSSAPMEKKWHSLER